MVAEVVAFVCGFCPRKKRFAARGTATRHEFRCFYNPVRRACATCQHFEYEKYEADTGAGGPTCAEGLLRNEPGEPPLRSECKGWQLRSESALNPPKGGAVQKGLSKEKAQ